MMAEAKYYINFTRSKKKKLFNSTFTGSNSFLFVNSVEIYQFKARNSEIKSFPLCLRNILKDFAVENMKKQDYLDTCTIFLLLIILLIFMNT